MNQKIGILLHQKDQSFENKSLMIWYIADFWQEMGFEIDILKGVPQDERSYDLLIAHINHTKVPTEYIDYLATQNNVLNLNVTDISKRNISKHLVEIDSGYTGPVIVKTDDNCAGLPESYLNRKKTKISNRLYNYLGYEFIRRLDPSNYQVYDSIGDVPRRIWKNKKMVVERFIPERVDDFYCIRVCHVLGDVLLNNRVCSNSKVIKGENITHVEKMDVPKDLHEMIREMGFDYGKLDYVVHDGKVSILDANKTPGTVGEEELNKKVAGKLAEGIYTFV